MIIMAVLELQSHGANDTHVIINKMDAKLHRYMQR